jgi:hypothetical protein
MRSHHLSKEIGLYFIMGLNGPNVAEHFRAYVRLLMPRLPENDIACKFTS